ncbi:MAG: OmpA family protein [Verrucomicrobia bacterium]|nr:OmpA family protein [Verrucomicrobiota bacterium]
MSAPIEDFPSAEQTVRGKFLLALFLAVGVHAGLFITSKFVTVESISPSFYNKVVPRNFTLKQAEVDPNTLAEPEAKPTPRPKPKPLTDLSAFAKQPSLDEMMAKADQVIAAPEVLDKTIAAEKPQLAPSDALTKALAETPKPADPAPGEPGSLLDRLRESKPAPNMRPMLEMRPGQPGEGNNGEAAPAPGQGNFSSLDGLLAGGGAVTDRTAPILLPTDLLFDYDRFQLRPEALDSLRKLGQLILRNPNADFLIEGHTDAYGSPSYNQTLSERRALSVKQWLVDDMKIDPARIQTRGFGASRPLAPATGNVEEQRLNRRVEIVIKTRRK